MSLNYLRARRLAPQCAVCLAADVMLVKCPSCDRWLCDQHLERLGLCARCTPADPPLTLTPRWNAPLYAEPAAVHARLRWWLAALAVSGGLWVVIYVLWRF